MPSRPGIVPRRWGPFGNSAFSAPGDTFLPTDLASLLAWYDPSDSNTVFQERTGASATTPSGDGDLAGTILDKSGNGYHLTAPTDDRRPVRRSSGDLWYLDFDGVDDGLLRSISDKSSGSITIIDAAALQESPAVATSFADASVNNLLIGSRYWDGSGVGGFLRESTRNVLVGTYTLGEKAVASVRFDIDAGSGDGRKNKSAFSAAQSSADTSLDRIFLGGSGDASTAYSEADIYGAVICDEYLSLSDADKVVEFLAAKGGITL